VLGEVRPALLFGLPGFLQPLHQLREPEPQLLRRIGQAGGGEGQGLVVDAVAAVGEVAGEIAQEG
jgi:hypothetical protein